jgi:D-xylose transport system ATP-binding protein
VLKGVDLAIREGTVTALVGDNGAGKSTLIKGLAGVQPYDEGVVRFAGGEASETLRSLSVRTVQSVRQKVSSLSGGQRQTVAIARAVLKKARVVILDEPTAALGVAQTAQVLALVKRLAEQGVAVVIISHNLADVFKVADYISVLYLGQMVASLEAASTNSSEVIGYITGLRMGTAA